MIRKNESIITRSKKRIYKRPSLTDFWELEARFTHKSEQNIEAEQKEEAMIRAKYEKVRFYPRKKYYKY